MARGLGTAALVAAFIAIVVPLYGHFVSAVAIVLAVGAALAGDRIFATATPIVVGVNMLFLSPLMWILILDKGAARSFYILLSAFLIAPFVAMLLNATGKIDIR